MVTRRKDNRNKILRRITITVLLLFLCSESGVVFATETKMERVFNFRDLGGYKTADGAKTVRKGVLFRSSELTFASERDLETLSEDLGIRTVIDLRYPADRKRCPDRKVAGAKNIHIPLRGVVKKRNAKADRKAIKRNKKFKSLEKTAASAEFLGEFAATSHKIKRKRTWQMFTSRVSRKSIKKYFEILLNNKDGDAVLFHCIQGKDRTGVVASVTLLALGVSEKNVISEYCKSNRAYKEARSAAYGGPKYGVRKSDIQYCLKRIKKKYGSYKKFLRKAYGLKDSDLKKLREMYLE